jgi:hypothetical protein
MSQPPTTITQAHIETLAGRCTLEFRAMGKKTTVCVATLPNGFEITTSAACVTAANFKESVGRELCIGKLKNKLWELEGYLLQHHMTLYEILGGAVSDDNASE